MGSGCPKWREGDTGERWRWWAKRVRDEYPRDHCGLDSGLTPIALPPSPTRLMPFGRPNGQVVDFEIWTCRSGQSVIKSIVSSIYLQNINNIKKSPNIPTASQSLAGCNPNLERVWDGGNAPKKEFHLTTPLSQLLAVTKRECKWRPRFLSLGQTERVHMYEIQRISYFTERGHITHEIPEAARRRK